MRLLTSRSLVQTQLGEILCAHHTDTAHSTHVHSVPHFFSLYIYSDTFFQAVQVCSLYQLHVRVDRVAGHFAACYQRILTIVLELFYRANILLTRCKKSQFHVRACKVTRVDAEVARVSDCILGAGRSQSEAEVHLPILSWFSTLYDPS